MYTCTIISSAAIILIALNMFGIFTPPKPGGQHPPSSFAGQFDWMYFLTFNVFPVLIVFNLVFWVITAVSGRMFVTRPALRQALQFFYVMITVALLAILALRIL